MSFRATSAKLVAFVVLTTITGLGVATVVGNLRFGAVENYQAVFSNATGLGNGEDVRIGGVPSGKVSGVELQPDGTAVVSFTVDSEHALTAGTTAAIKYKNLIGDRYLDLSQGDPNPRELTEPIPLDQTTPALDLDQVVNGFRPLLQGLNPDETNRLSTSLVQVLNGQESAVGELVTEIGSLTRTLADRDLAIGNTITNFNTVLGSVDERRDTVSALVDQLQRIVGGLNEDSGAITASLESIDGLTESLADVLSDNRADLTAEIASLGSLSSRLNEQTDTLNLILSKLPENYRLTGRAAGYGNFVNFFVCGLAVKYGSGAGDVSPMFTAPAERCK
ncbi:MCE family protein [Rhodococcoides kyotonense]|uniref:Mammalian cell entry protein n=1 Tax=Rhodococcoides kyotonense TaxID=398843 RepID=A0A177YLX3_9NOCA|nr:MCE family protein [Rhodococcus kyotonensis]OAK56219.1 mammalian cell entry protein [Rhodococcus kyotonensis]